MNLLWEVCNNLHREAVEGTGLQDARTSQHFNTRPKSSSEPSNRMVSPSWKSQPPGLMHVPAGRRGIARSRESGPAGAASLGLQRADLWDSDPHQDAWRPVHTPPRVATRPWRGAVPRCTTARGVSGCVPRVLYVLFRMRKEERLRGKQNHQCSQQAVGCPFLCRPTGE